MYYYFLLSFFFSSRNRYRRSRADVYENVLSDSEKITTLMTEISATNQDHQHNRPLRTSNDYIRTPSVEGEGNHGHSKLHEVQHIHYENLDNSNKDYANTAHPLDRRGQELNRKDPNGPFGKTKVANRKNYDFQETQGKLPGVYEELDHNNISLQDPIGQTNISPATNDSNSEYLIPLPAQPGIYVDLNKTDMDSEHAYQPLDKRSQKLIRRLQDLNSPSSETMTASCNNDFRKTQREPAGVYEDLNEYDGSNSISHSSKSPAISDSNSEYLTPLLAQPGIYVDLDK